LDAVLAEIPLAGGKGFANRIDRKELRDGHESNGGGGAAAGTRRGIDARAHGGELLGDGHKTKKRGS
jgi:hypothetical protein